MIHSNPLRGLHIASVAALFASAASAVIACSSAPGEALGTQSQALGGAFRSVAAVKGPNDQSTAPGGAHLNDYGGPVLSNPKVVTIFWGSNVAYASQINAFYSGITNSAYMDWLSEYDTSSQNIGRGAFGGSYVDTAAPTGTITDAQVQAEISRLITNGSVPAPDANTLYAVHYAPGVRLLQPDGTASCAPGGFCGYHGTFVRNGADVYYSNVMDMTTGACAGGCGSDPSVLNNTTAVASHELLEAATDPGVGLATVYGPPLGWYDPSYGEVGDICNAQHGLVVGGDGATYTVQKAFSNRVNDCVASTPPSSSMILWLRADAGVTTTSGGTVTSWLDQSPSKNVAAMSTPSREPAYVAGALNGYPVIRFNGAQSLILSNAVGPWTFSFFIVGKNSQPTETHSIILGPSGYNANNQLRWDSGTQSLLVGLENKMPITRTTIGNTRVYHELSGTYDGRTLSIYRDRQLMGTAVFGTDTLWHLNQVGGWFSSDFMVGDLAEIIMYAAPLADGPRSDVDTYLRNKYGLP